MARILIIEDEFDVADLYRLTLELEGHEIVAIYDDPRDALPHPDRPEKPLLEPDLIILDERLRGISGTSYLPRLRATFPETRILVATADPAIGPWALMRGADDVKHKPFAMRQLRRYVDFILAPSR